MSVATKSISVDLLTLDGELRSVTVYSELLIPSSCDTKQIPFSYRGTVRASTRPDCFLVYNLEESVVL